MHWLVQVLVPKCVLAGLGIALALSLGAYFAIYGAFDGQTLSLDSVVRTAPRLICELARICSS